MALTNRLSVAAAVAACTLGAAANADIIAGWTFQSSSFVSTTVGAQTFTYPQSGTDTSFSSRHNSANTKWYNNVGNGSTASFNADNWQAGDWNQATLSTAGYSNISINFDITRSASGPASFAVRISTDGGANFTDILASMPVIVNAGSPTGAGNWTSATYNAAYTTTINNVTAAANQNSLIVRWVALVGGTATGGTARMDNVQVQGTLLPAPGAAALVGLAGLMARRRRD